VLVVVHCCKGIIPQVNGEFLIFDRGTS